MNIETKKTKESWKVEINQVTRTSRYGIVREFLVRMSLDSTIFIQSFHSNINLNNYTSRIIILQLHSAPTSIERLSITNHTFISNYLLLLCFCFVLSFFVMLCTFANTHIQTALLFSVWFHISFFSFYIFVFLSFLLPFFCLCPFMIYDTIWYR